MSGSTPNLTVLLCPSRLVNSWKCLVPFKHERRRLNAILKCMSLCVSESMITKLFQTFRLHTILIVFFFKLFKKLFQEISSIEQCCKAGKANISTQWRIDKEDFGSSRVHVLSSMHPGKYVQTLRV